MTRHEAALEACIKSERLHKRPVTAELLCRHYKPRYNADTISPFTAQDLLTQLCKMGKLIRVCRGKYMVKV